MNTTAMLFLRLDVLGGALQEICRALAQSQAAQVAAALQERLGGAFGADLGPSADESAAAELAGLLVALGELQGAQATSRTD